jgi:ParB-like chromosome segregation protein Spo0J
MKISDLKPLEKNPFKSRGDAQIQAIAKSIQEFERMMTIRKIVIDENNEILGGNKRYYALKKLGYKEIPDEWIEKVEGLTEEQKREFIVKDNSHWNSEWDLELLNEWGVDLADWGVEAEWGGETGDIVELPNITTTYNVNIKCDSPEQVEELKDRLGITSNSIHVERLITLLK